MIESAVASRIDELFPRLNTYDMHFSDVRGQRIVNAP